MTELHLRQDIADMGEHFATLFRQQNVLLCSKFVIRHRYLQLAYSFPLAFLLFIC